MGMKASELRIGNWINIFGIPKQVDGLMIVGLSQIEAAHKIALDMSPIELTPEILTRAGFDAR